MKTSKYAVTGYWRAITAMLEYVRCCGIFWSGCCFDRFELVVVVKYLPLQLGFAFCCYVMLVDRSVFGFSSVILSGRIMMEAGAVVVSSFMVAAVGAIFSL